MPADEPLARGVTLINTKALGDKKLQRNSMKFPAFLMSIFYHTLLVSLSKQTSIVQEKSLSGGCIKTAEEGGAPSQRIYSQVSLSFPLSFFVGGMS